MDANSLSLGCDLLGWFEAVDNAASCGMEEVGGATFPDKINAVGGQLPLLFMSFGWYSKYLDHEWRAIGKFCSLVADYEEWLTQVNLKLPVLLVAFDGVPADSS